MAGRRSAYLRALGVDEWRRRLNDIVPQDLQAPAALSPAAAKATAAASMPAALPAAEPGSLAVPAGDPGWTAGMEWEALEQAVRTCSRCILHTSRTQAVFGVGDRRARWMIIGEAPGAEEDRQGEPFVGRAGQLLNTMLKAIGLLREQVFIANVLKCRPPGNRDPKPAEAHACLPYLYRQIELIDPVVILCLGRVAAQTLLKTDTPIGKLRGRLHHIGRWPLIVTYHPAYLLRSPGEKRKSWSDLVLAMRTFERCPASGS